MKYPYYRWITHDVDAFCLQSEYFYDHLKDLIRPTTNTVITGNMKLDLEVAPIDETREQAIREWLASRGPIPLLAAGSTAIDIDEEFVFGAYEKVKGEVPCALLIAPRKLTRAPVTAENAKERGHRVSLRTTPSKEPCDVYVLDTLGELSHSYQYSEAAFIGGTIVSTGHNVIEPVLWGKPVSYGPLRGHFQDLQLICERFGVGFRCLNSNDLAQHWLKCLKDRAFREEIAARAKEMFSHERGATQKTVAAVMALIPTHPKNISHTQKA